MSYRKPVIATNRPGTVDYVVLHLAKDPARFGVAENNNETVVKPVEKAQGVK